MMKKLGLTVLLLGVALVAAWNFVAIPSFDSWSAEELRLISSLSIERLAPLPADPSNRVADLPAAVEFGYRLFFDTRLSGNGSVACATCHRPELMFTDGFQLAMGMVSGPRHTPSLVGLSHSPWYYWDGRKDSQWAQALAPLEAAIEHDIDRLQVARLINSDSSYRQMYNTLFGPLPVIPATPVAASPLGDEQEQ
ncbi:MAG: cytochrome-c peroxidase, partial [Gammaproteobacteria bacterium]|nr:cytochrome-c peroxidase [Gammaproteobacteria bacterium]